MKAVIWDMDGVLIDSETRYKISDAKMFKELGIDEFTEADSKYLLGVTPRSGARNILDHHPEVEKSWDELTEIYAQSLYDAIALDPTLTLVDGLDEWLPTLKKDGYKLAIASSSTRKMVMHIVERFGLDKIMDAVICGDMITKSKPDPEIFLLAAEKMGVEPENCTVVEDSAAGITAAGRAGMRCIAFNGANIHHFDQSKADVIIETFNMDDYKKLF